MKNKFVEDFIDLLEDNGDMFFSCGDINKDYELIQNTIKGQGYWAGNSLRYYFDEEIKTLVKTEERNFA